MKRYLPLILVSLLLFLLASAFSITVVIDVLTLPQNPEAGSEAFGAGLTRAFGLVFLIIAALVNLLSAVLSLIGLLIVRRHSRDKKTTVIFTCLLILPLLVSALSLLLVLL